MGIDLRKMLHGGQQMAKGRYTLHKKAEYCKKRPTVAFAEGSVSCTLRLNIMLKNLKGYVYRRHLHALHRIGKLVLLQICRWKFSQKETVLAEFVRFKLIFIHKKRQIRFFEPQFVWESYRGNYGLRL